MFHNRDVGAWQTIAVKLSFTTEMSVYSVILFNTAPGVKVNIIRLGKYREGEMLLQLTVQIYRSNVSSQLSFSRISRISVFVLCLVRILCCGVKTVGKCFHSTLLQFVQLYI